MGRRDLLLISQLLFERYFGGFLWLLANSLEVVNDLGPRVFSLRPARLGSAELLVTSNFFKAVSRRVLVVVLLAMLLKVLVRAAILNKLGCPGEDIRILVEGDRLNHICGQQVHERLNVVHLCVHLFRHSVLDGKALKHTLSRDAFPLRQEVDDLG